MKFDQIILSGSSSVTLFDLKNPRSTPYAAKTIDGLGPTDVDVTLAQTSQGAGVYIGRREQLREITINANLNANYMSGQTPEMLREAIYLLRPVNEDMSLDFRLMLDGVEVAVTPVYIKRVDISPFSKDTLIQIVLASTSGYFQKRTPSFINDPTFDPVNPIITNEGTNPTGFKLIVDFNDVITSFAIRQFAPTVDLKMDKLVSDSTLFTVGDRLEINTNIGSRGVWMTRGGVTTSIMGTLAQNSSWISLHPGDNELLVTSVPAIPSRYTWKYFEHTPKYRGV